MIIKLNLILLGFIFLIIPNDFISNIDYQGELNSIDIDCVKVNNQIKIGSTQGQVINLFGKPDLIEELFVPLIDENPTYRYKYKNSYFDIYESKVESFYIKDSFFSTINFHPGMNLNELKKKFPESFSLRYESGDDPSLCIVRILIDGKNHFRESSILVKINKDEIVSIEYWEEY